MRKDDKLQLLAGVAAVSAVIAMVLILSNLFIIIPLLTEFIGQMPVSAASMDDIIGQLARVNVQAPNGIDLVALLATASFLIISISSTAAVSKLHLHYSK